MSQSPDFAVLLQLSPGRLIFGFSYTTIRFVSGNQASYP